MHCFMTSYIFKSLQRLNDLKQKPEGHSRKLEMVLIYSHLYAAIPSNMQASCLYHVHVLLLRFCHFLIVQMISYWSFMVCLGNNVRLI